MRLDKLQELPSRTPESIVAGYVPVIHKGYMSLWERYADASIGVFDNEIVNSFDYLRKDIRALDPEMIRELIVGIGREATLVGFVALNSYVYRERGQLIMPDDDISRGVMEIAGIDEQDVVLEPVFLRWDRKNSVDKLPVEPSRVVSLEDNDAVLIALINEAEKSTNWWRSVGAVICDDEKAILQGHNSSLPTEFSSWIDGDPRIVANRGSNIELSIDIHAEARLVAEASKCGIALEGKNIFVSTFPCPNCAKLIAMSGVNKCYYIDGYATLDGSKILEQSGVEIIKIDYNMPNDSNKIYVPYPSKS